MNIKKAVARNYSMKIRDSSEVRRNLTALFYFETTESYSCIGDYYNSMSGKKSPAEQLPTLKLISGLSSPNNLTY